MAKLGTLPLTGQSGQDYNFDVYAWGSQFTAVGAVYYISKRTEKSDGTGSHDKIYVGQTSDLSERFDNHHKANCFQRNNVNAISLYLENNESARLSIEEDLINALNPPCNG